MSLTGNLEVFPLEEVLRLLARSRKDGCLRVNANGDEGRVFLSSGSLVFASTESDDVFRRSLLVAGVVPEERIGTLDLGQTTVVEAAGDDGTAHDFVRETIVESLYRLRKPGRGTFDFVLEARPRYATGVTYDVEVAVSEADRRAAEWADIEGAVADLGAPFTMTPALTEDEQVTISPATWKLLAAFGGSGSIPELAERLGSTEFRVAREIAALTRQGLVEAERADAPAEWQPPEPQHEEPQHDEPQRDEPQYGEEPEAAPTGGGGWWHEPSSEPVEVPDTAAEAGEPASADEQPADSFLEQVFQQLDEEPEQSEEDPDDGFGVGLLRRRRMGAITRDMVDGDS